MSSRLLRDAVAIAVETLSWMELEGLSERPAFAKTTRQLGVRNRTSMRTAFLFILETTRALNLVDRIATSIMPQDRFENLDLGKKNFLRMFIWWVVLRKVSRQDSVDLLEAARHVLGWKELRDLEVLLGKILTLDQSTFMNGIQDPERTALCTFNRTWFVSYCYRVFGRRFALAYLRSTCTSPPVYVRINTSDRIDQHLIREIEGEGVKIDAVKDLDWLFRVVQTRKPLTLTRAYRQGVFSIQDKSSYLSTVVAGPKRGETILDLCAAPGGKTSHIALGADNSATVYSIDLSRKRMSVWKKEMERCNISCVIPIVADARQSLPIKQTFDLVLVDPPCTNSGAFGKTPSLKWRLTANALGRLCQIQWGIVSTAVQVVKPGGRLIYSTCSITVEENELQIERLLKVNPEFELEKQTPFIGHEGLRGLAECQRLYPHLDGCNGYFVASLKRQY